MTKEHIKKSKEYAMSRTYPRFDSVFISNFVHKEIEGAYLEGSKETENLEYRIKDVQRALNKWERKAKELEQTNNKLLDVINNQDVKIADLEKKIEKMKCCGNCKSFRGYGETCEGWGEPVLNLNCDCTEWKLKE